MLKTSEYVLDEGSVIIFDCGGNTKKNKRLVRSKKFHYITLKPKKKGPYKHLIRFYDHPNYKHVSIVLNEKKYTCVKVKIYHEYNYIYFSENLYNDQMKTKDRRYLKELEKNKQKLKKTLSGKVVDEYLCEEVISSQKDNYRK